QLRRVLLEELLRNPYPRERLITCYEHHGRAFVIRTLNEMIDEKLIQERPTEGARVRRFVELHITLPGRDFLAQSRAV
ncbi:MAG TPA: hypothetical protein VJY84_01615, partial [Candidatus Saccharimonadales bacterium]|nr:hypothetical protein [Candidatus Saccharimonadales bacterium]